MIVALSAGRDAPSDLRARMALDDAGQQAVLKGPRPGIAELAVLSTCHRTEYYATGDGLDADVVHAVAALIPGLLPTDHHDLRFMAGSEAIEHLFRVASGLDSLVIGEPQVLGQVRRAFVLAEDAGTAGPVLSNIFGRAMRIGKEVRSETAIGRLSKSIGSIAAEHLDERSDGLAGKSALVVGAGEAATDAAKALRKYEATIKVASRTLSSAEELAAQVEGTAHTLDELGHLFASTDFAVVAITGGMLINSVDIPQMTSAPYLVVDLSMPRAVEAMGRQDVAVLSLEEIPGPRGPEITSAMIDAEAMVRKEVADLLHWADTRASGPVIKDLRGFGESVVRDELNRALNGAQISDEDRERIEMLANRIANKILHGPTAELRRADESTRALIRRIFHLEP